MKNETLLRIGQKWTRRRGHLDVTIDAIGPTLLTLVSCIELIVYHTPRKTFFKNYKKSEVR